MNLGEKFRRTINSLESHTELRNLIGEEEDVAKAYEKIVKQNNDRVIYLNKWSNKETEYKALFGLIGDHTTPHNAIITEFAKQYRIYIVGLKEILLKTEKLHSEDKHIKELEEKVAKRKASESQLTEAKSHREVLANELQRMKDATLKLSFVNLTKAYCEMYSQGLQQMNKQLVALGADTTYSTASFSQPNPYAQSAQSSTYAEQPQRRASNPPAPVYNEPPQYQYQQQQQQQQQPDPYAQPPRREPPTNPTLYPTNDYQQYQQPVEQHSAPVQHTNPLPQPPRKISNPPNLAAYGYPQNTENTNSSLPQPPPRRVSNPPVPAPSASNNPFDDFGQTSNSSSVPQLPRRPSNPPAVATGNGAPQMPPRKLSNPAAPSPFSYGAPPSGSNVNAIKPANH